jgi:hypothetical protein
MAKAGAVSIFLNSQHTLADNEADEFFLIFA